MNERRLFSLDTDPPTVLVEAAYSKHRREDVLPLRAETAALIREYLALKLPKASVFPMWKGRGSEMMQTDLEAAGIDYVDESGGYADFHSLRHSYISALARCGVHPKTAQSLARHSTITLTMDRYTHTILKDQSAALQRLPDLSPDEDDQEEKATGTADQSPQNNVASSVAEQGGFDEIQRDETGQSGCKIQASAEKQKVQKSLENKGFSGISETSEGKKTGTPSRTRTWDPLIKNQIAERHNMLNNKEVTEKPNDGMASSVASKNENRSGLTFIVSAWDQLPEPIRVGILAMVKSAAGGGV